ncbi:histone deacetylase [Candidatus Dependentiae bacterium]
MISFTKRRLISLALCLSIAFSASMTQPWFGFFKKKKPQSGSNRVEKLPIVGGREYDIKFFGLERLHPFDSAKYGKVERFLVNKLGISKNRFVKPRMVTDQELLTVHTQRYLDLLKKSSTVKEVTEVPGINWVPNFLLRRYILNPMKLATGGTIQAVQLALQHGWSINLGGGYHHAKTNEGGGFCFYADIPIAVKKLWLTNPNLRVMVIDLDAHQGNGHEQVFGNDHRVKIFDMYNRDAYPRDERAKRHITFDVPVDRGINGDRYIQILRQRLDSALNQLEQQKQKPDLIIFNAGTDPLDGDRLGGMRVSEEKMIERDDIVFEQAKRRRIPITYLFSGGYTSQSSRLIGRSLENVLRKHLRVRSGRRVNNVPKLFES